MVQIENNSFTKYKVPEWDYITISPYRNNKRFKSETIERTSNINLDLLASTLVLPDFE